jgi:hypothetical protein
VSSVGDRGHKEILVSTESRWLGECFCARWLPTPDPRPPTLLPENERFQTGTARQTFVPAILSFRRSPPMHEGSVIALLHRGNANGRFAGPPQKASRVSASKGKTERSTASRIHTYLRKE